MSDLIQVIGDSNCGDCSQSLKIKGCANNVPYLQIVTSTGISPATVTFINLIDGVISSTAPAGYATGDCPAYEEVDLVKTNWLPICVAGVQWYVLESSTYNNATLIETTPVKLYKQGANGTIVTVAPIGTIVEGICSIQALPTQRIHQNFVITGTTPLVISAGVISISVTKTNNTGVVNISGDNATAFPLTFNRENFTDSVNEGYSTLSAYTITGTAAGTTYKVHIIR